VAGEETWTPKERCLIRVITNAFTCNGQYAILIMLGIKRIENRSVMPVPSKGRCAVSCSKSFNAAEYGNFVQWASTHLPSEDFERIPAWADVKDWPGKIVGVCDYAASVEKPFVLSAADTPTFDWDEGYAYWWRLSEVVCFDQPIPCRGNVGMWQMPPALAAQVAAADALAQCEGTTIATTADAERLFRLAIPIAGSVEGFFMLPLDADRRVLSEPILVSLGDPTTTVVQPGEVFAAAIKLDAKAIILAHNHPSGNPTPSLQDKQLTDALSRLGSDLGVRVVDHLVIGDCGFQSALVT